MVRASPTSKGAKDTIDMSISKTTLELSAVAALLAVMLGGFYYQGSRLDDFGRRQEARVDGLEQRLNTRIDGVEQRMVSMEQRLDARIDGLAERINGLAERLARIEGILERWLATMPARPDQQAN